jgi:exonuclease III
VRILFWNVGGRDRSDLIATIARERNVDILVLAETPDPTNVLVTALARRNAGTYAEPPGVYGRVKMVARMAADAVEPILDTGTLMARHISPPLGASFLLIGAHLQSRLRQDTQDQLVAGPRLRDFVERAEEQVGHRRTILIGDLNMNPFDGAVVAADGLHAVMSRAVAAQMTRTVQEEERRFFYNPMWNHFGDRGPSPPGTYYYRDNGQIVMFWNIFDQVLLRPELLEFFEDEDVVVVTQIAGKPLLRPNGRPNRDVGSDHLPIVLTVGTERQF